ncbi:hypothetical protein BCIN_13g00820 [Botrytis cinerea B05.10]|uniref:Uncharacterized protein n=2 Tax=Botryotinia fuckeliana TaxID=40559 RepID=A0A384K090_BOTFB|nr:hypothetical protein BCIN_13g00820 [Botrytis cinerea B05.10]ATZ56233.1 hypothetical protein BCIN_13g00820 [Botrytis cinerea B05.10]
MGGYESDAGERDDRSVSHRSDHSRSSRSSRRDGNGSDTHLSTKRVPRTRGEGPPISMNTRYPRSNGGSSSHGRSQSHNRDASGSELASNASGSTLRPSSRRGESRHRSDDIASQASGATLRSLQSSRVDTASQGGGSYASKPHSETRKRYKPEPNRGSGYEQDWKDGRNVYLISDDDEPRNPRKSVPRSEASGHTARSVREMAKLSEQTKHLNLDPQDDPRDKVEKLKEELVDAEWEAEVKSKTSEGRHRRDSNRPSDLISIATGEDYSGKSQSITSYDGSTTSNTRSKHPHGRPRSNADYSRSQTSNSSYNAPPPRSFASGYAPSNTQSQPRDGALEVYRGSYAPSTSGSHASHHSSRSHARQYPDPRRSPPPRRGPYVGGHHNVLEHAETNINMTYIGAPDMSFMNEPSKKERRRQKEHELHMEMVRNNMRPPVKKTIWDD